MQGQTVSFDETISGVLLMRLPHSLRSLAMIRSSVFRQCQFFKLNKY
ncbi:hypothetical protein APHACPA_0038 [Rickettsia amblyommatis str. Ac/Pa]|uniref:Uncharacterized protein n=1 Tax=Rickettsia amblyommatis str. Ac/Pa TaxID=1359164 RepID=A0A0F3N2B7_RICAM|nr:hypothetical protein APHACPA_0038 [Rickettsia amblyommatis str. Ac/Pa]